MKMGPYSFEEYYYPVRPEPVKDAFDCRLSQTQAYSGLNPGG